ncbi:uncharacterized protein LOC123507791 [Portunus trituberculatus]|uniref:uncharacterized protein LOC123507791 n=1 Tax=Portunus trituberculatus TaxID=210409 RepID=UPI001E1D21CB|nr:uncharacterized protein LOC123507791 [Portunus trituberculatus]
MDLNTTSLTTTMPTTITTTTPPPTSLPMAWPLLAFLAVVVGGVLVGFAVWAWRDIRDTYRWYQEVVFLDEEELRREREAEREEERRAEDERNAANQIDNTSRSSSSSYDSLFYQQRRSRPEERRPLSYPFTSYFTMDSEF